MDLKTPKSNIKNVVVLNIDEEILKKLCFRETLLISRCVNVENDRECMHFTEKCLETCPNEEQCADGAYEISDIDKELFHPRRSGSIESIQDNPDRYSERRRQSGDDVNKRNKWKRNRELCKKTRSCVRKTTRANEKSNALKISDRSSDVGYEYTEAAGEDFFDRSPKDIRVLKLSDCSTSGGFCINIENVGQHLLLYLASQFGVDGYTAGSTIISTSDLNFTLIEERKCEFIIRPDDKVEEKRLHVALDEERYTVVKTHKYGDNFDKDNGVLEFKNAKDLLFDGAGIILMRYLAITNFRGSLELSTMLINGDVAEMIIRSTGYKKAWLCNSLQDVIEIEKIIIEKYDIVHKSLSVLTPNGHLIKHEWDGCDYLVHINPIADVPRAISGDPISWEADIELFSRYLDYKSKRKADHTSYMIDTPEVRAIVSDYIEYILLTKPSDILNFTVDYFKCLRPF